MSNEIFWGFGFLIAIAVLYIFIRNLLQARKISKELKDANKPLSFPAIPSVFKQWAILAISALTLVGFLLGYYAGSHGAPTMTSDAVIQNLQNNSVLTNAFPGIEYKTIYYSPNQQKYRISAETTTASIYIEYDDSLNMITAVNPIPKTISNTQLATNPTPTTQPQQANTDKISASNKPALGATNAKNVVYEYSDYQCPYCKQGNANINELMKTRSQDTQVIFKQFPLTGLHPQAYPAALASECANEQNKFWEFTDYAFNHQELLAKTTEGGNTGLLGIAAAINLNQIQFADCLGKQKYKEQVDKEITEGQTLGITGTPTFIINGIIVSGAVPATELEKYLK